MIDGSLARGQAVPTCPLGPWLFRFRRFQECVEGPAPRHKIDTYIPHPDQASKVWLNLLYLAITYMCVRHHRNIQLIGMGFINLSD